MGSKGSSAGGSDAGKLQNVPQAIGAKQPTQSRLNEGAVAGFQQVRGRRFKRPAAVRLLLLPSRGFLAGPEPR